jgi:hypothetical protein
VLKLPGAITTATVNRSMGSAGVTVQATFLPAHSPALMQAEVIARISPIGLLPMRVPGRSTKQSKAKRSRATG